jgi:hypothetical protein
VLRLLQAAIPNYDFDLLLATDEWSVHSLLCCTHGVDTVQVAATLHKRWSHVLVDEGQDTNLCQFELVRQITGPHSKLFMVGDPDQVREQHTFHGGADKLSIARHSMFGEGLLPQARAVFCTLWQQ